MKKYLKLLLTLALIAVLINASLTINESFTEEETSNSKKEHSAGYFKMTDYGTESSNNLNSLNKKNSKTIVNGKKNIEKSEAILKKVNQVLIAEDVYYPGASEPSEYYMSVLLNRASGKNMIMYSTEGGMDIEAVAEATPHLIFTEEVDPALGLLPFQARKIAFNLGLSGAAFKDMTKFVSALYKAYMGSDASLFEINPVLKTSDDKIIAVDAKVTLDDNGLFRHKELEALRDLSEENPVEVEAREVGLNYVDLDGNVGCMVNGAGLAMATMDLIKQAGGDPANFLDVGGTADAARVETAFRLILKDPDVKAILINIFGGIVRCDRVAQGIVDAYKNLGDAIQVPIIVRLQGTNADIAKELIDSSGLNVLSATAFQEAADKVQEAIA